MLHANPSDHPATSDTHPQAVKLHAYLTKLIWLCVLPLMVLAVYLAANNVRTLQEEREQKAEHQAQNFAIAIDRNLGARIAALQMLAASPLMNGRSRLPDFYEEAQGFHEHFGGHVVLADLSMQMLFNTRVPFGSPLPKLPRPKGHSAAVTTMETGKPAVGDIFIGPIAKEPLVAIAVPVVRKGRTTALLLSIVETSLYQQRIESLALPAGWSITLLDGKDEVMARLAPRDYSSATSRTDASGRFVARSTVSLWSVVVELPPGMLRSPIAATSATLIGAIIAVLFVSILGGRLAGRKLVQAITSLSDAAARSGTTPVIAEIEEARIRLYKADDARQASEESLRTSEQKYRTVFEAANVGKSMTLPSGEISVNKAFSDLLGYSQEELRNRTWQEITPPEEVGPIQERIGLLMDGSRDSTRFEKRYIHKNGSFVWADVSVAIRRDAEGKPLYFITTMIDITERKRMERDLIESEKRYRSLFENMTSGFVLFEVVQDDERSPIDLIIIAANKGFETTTGLKAREVAGKRLTHVLPGIEMDTADWIGTYGRVALTGDSLRFERRSERLGYDYSIAAYQAGPKQVGVLFTDITEQKRAERALLQAHDRLQKFIDSNIVGVVIADPSGRVIEANDYYLRTIGYTRSEFERGMVDWRAITPPEWLPADERAIRELRDRGTCTPYEKEYVRRDGSRVSVFLSDTMLPGPGEHIAAFALDITERKKTERALAESEANFRKLSQEFHALLDAIPDNLTLQSSDLKVIWANKGAADGLGKKLEDIVGLHCYTLWHGRTEPCDPCPVLDSFSTGRPAGLVVTTPDGRTWDLRTIPLLDDRGDAATVIEVGRDITEHRRLEAQYLQAQKMEAIGHLAGGVAHDFNNILSAIIGYGHLTLMNMREDDPLRLNIENILEASDRAAYLTQELLLFGRKQVTERKPLDLNDVLLKVKKFLLRVIGADVEFETFPFSSPLPILADSHQLEQVLMNLATNARDAMPKGGTFTVATEQVALGADFCSAHGYGKPGAYALLTASDTGKGMNEETCKRIFEPFFTTKEVGKGTGLGLAVVYGIIKRHEGFINVYSEPNKGTRFKIYLPLVAREPREGVAMQADDMPARGTETILLAEDDPSLRQLAKTVLTTFGYSVLEANDGKDAVEKFIANRDRIQLLLFDLVMPKMNGKEAFDEVRKINACIKAVFVSGYAEDALDKDSLPEHDVLFIQKPVTPIDLLRKVRELLDR